MRCLTLVLLTCCGLIHAKPLNVVFILADDLGFGELGSYGQQKIRTPHLDQLAREGTRFTRHYTGAPTCAPARCTLLTGRHGGHAEIRGNRQAKLAFPEFSEGQHPISAEVPTLPQSFRTAGYRTAAIGKWGLGPVGSTGDPNRKGFDLFFGYNCQAVAHSFFPRFLWRNAERIEINPKPIPGHAKQPDGPVLMEPWQGQTYAPDLMRAEAVNFIETHKNQPFFLFLAFIEPHVSIHPPPDRVAAYPADWDTQPYRGENGYLPHPRPRAAYAAMITDLDAHVGAVRSALEKAGVLDQTLIVFTSDNGTTHPGKPGTHFHIGGCDAPFFNSTAGLRDFKGSLHEGGIRVPTIARLPGKIPAGTVNATPCYFPDWFPTLCAAAGITPPPDLDGTNLWPVITGETPTVSRKSPLIWAFQEYGGQVAILLEDNLKAIRKGLTTRKPGPWEIYDLAADPAEAHDLAATRPEAIARATEILKRELSTNRLFPLTVPGVNDAPTP